MDRRASGVLLVVLGAGVFLAGLELMITAVALPSIITYFARNELFPLIELRKASWIINGYLLVYIVTMPLAGRLSDLWGARRVFLTALALFTFGSALAGRAQSLDELIGARLVQALGGGALVPVATAAAAHLYEGHNRPRALGMIGALTFLGMAAGPFVGAAVLQSVHPDVALERLGVAPGALADSIGPAWRWVFYLNVPIGLIAFPIAWAASAGWETERRSGGLDLAGALTLTIALATGLVGLTLLGGSSADTGGQDPGLVSAVLFGTAVVATVLTIVGGLVGRAPFLDPRLFRDRAFSSAVLVSLLTGYGLATAIIGGAVFVDRVKYGGPGEQQLALGALAGSTAIGALVSGFLVRGMSLRAVSLIGLVASVGGLALMATWTPTTSMQTVAVSLALFGAGFGLTVTPRSTAAVESVARSAFGTASAAVTVARMLGMAVGLAVLTAYGSTTITRLQAQVYATPDSYKLFIPVELRDRALRDGLVVEALETWAASEAARIMVGIFVAAALVTAAAAVPALALGRRARMLAPGPAGSGEAGPTPPADRAGSTGDATPGDDDREPTFAL
jgi:MFS family permease